MEKKLLRKKDIFLIAILVAILLIIISVLSFSNRQGSKVIVSVDGSVTASYPLSEDLTTTIEGYNGGTNTLVIKDGKAFLTDTSCPDHLCEKMGRISSVGQSVICLPNRVVIEITGEDSSEYDAVVGG